MSNKRPPLSPEDQQKLDAALLAYMTSDDERKADPICNKLRGLLAAGADPNIRDENGSPMVLLAATGWKPNSFTDIFMHDPRTDLTVTDAQNRTLIHYACNKEMVVRPILDGVDIHHRDADGKTARQRYSNAVPNNDGFDSPKKARLAMEVAAWIEEQFHNECFSIESYANVLCADLMKLRHRILSGDRLPPAEHRSVSKALAVDFLPWTLQRASDEGLEFSKEQLLSLHRAGKMLHQPQALLTITRYALERGERISLRDLAENGGINLAGGLITPYALLEPKLWAGETPHALLSFYKDILSTLEDFGLSMDHDQIDDLHKSLGKAFATTLTLPSTREMTRAEVQQMISDLPEPVKKAMPGLRAFMVAKDREAMHLRNAHLGGRA